MVRAWCTFALGCLHIAGASAAEPLREGQFLAFLDEGHPALSMASESLGLARADVARAQALPNPLFDWEREGPSENPTVSTFSLAWTPPLDGRRGPQVRAARYGFEAARADLEAATLLLRRDMRASFAEWAIATERQRIVDEHASLIARLAEQIRVQAETGEVSRLAARRVGLAAVEGRGEQAAAGTEALAARSTASLWAGRDLAEADPVLPELPPIPGDTLSVERHPEVVAKRSELAAFEHERRLAGRFLRFPEIRAGWQRIDDANLSDEGPVIGLSWSLPLFDRDQGGRIAADAQVAAARSRLEFTERRVQTGLKSREASYALLHESASSALAALEDADRVTESAVASYRLGESRLTDLLDTLRSVLAARMASLDLLESALQAHRDLEVAAGHALVLE